jgi:hypothetical protein
MLGGKKKPGEKTDIEATQSDEGNREQKEVLKALLGTVVHFFGSWQTIFAGVRDRRNPDLITYPMVQLL